MKDYSYLVDKPSPQEILHMDLVCKPSPDEICHYGILGMHWGIRRYQNPDGTLTEAGKKRYGTYEEFKRKQKEKILKDPKLVRKHYDELTPDEIKKAKARFDDIEKLRKSENANIRQADELIKSVIAYGTTALVAYKLVDSDLGKDVRKMIKSFF